MAMFKCSVANRIKDTSIRVCIKGYSEEAIEILDLDENEKKILLLIEGDRVSLAWDIVTEELVHVNQFKLTKNSKLEIKKNGAQVKGVTKGLVFTVKQNDTLPDLDDEDENKDAEN